MLAHCAGDLAAAIREGDLEAARIAHQAIGRLLGTEEHPPTVIEVKAGSNG